MEGAVTVRRISRPANALPTWTAEAVQARAPKGSRAACGRPSARPRSPLPEVLRRRDCGPGVERLLDVGNRGVSLRHGLERCGRPETQIAADLHPAIVAARRENVHRSPRKVRSKPRSAGPRAPPLAGASPSAAASGIMFGALTFAVPNNRASSVCAAGRNRPRATPGPNQRESRSHRYRSPVPIPRTR